MDISGLDPITAFAPDSPTDTFGSQSNDGVILPPPGLPAAATPVLTTAVPATPIIPTTNRDTLFVQWYENRMLDSFYIIQAARIDPKYPHGLTIEGNIAGWAALEKYIRGLGYSLEGSDPWRHLGLSQDALSGSPEQDIDSRLQIVMALLSYGDRAEWCCEDRMNASAAGTIMTQAARECNTLLPEARTKAVKVKPQEAPEILEASAPLMDFVTTKYPLAQIGLQLSNLVTPNSNYPNTLPMGECKTLYSELGQGNEKGYKLLMGMPGGHYIIWAQKFLKR